jgi:phytoene dehydrogenase-like protein
VHVIEQDARLGGCVDTRTTGDGFWIELGAHTCYNSYGAFIELLEGLDLLGELQPRGKPVLRFVEAGAILPGANMGAMLRQMSLWQLARSVPRMLWASPDGQTVKSHYSRLVGAGNYERALGPMLSAVPSQRADAFPADMLFKKRPRRKDVIRSFTLKGGLGAVVERIRRLAGVTSPPARRTSSAHDAGFRDHARRRRAAHRRAGRDRHPPGCGAPVRGTRRTPPPGSEIRGPASTPSASWFAPTIAAIPTRRS